MSHERDKPGRGNHEEEKKGTGYFVSGLRGRKVDARPTAWANRSTQADTPKEVCEGKEKGGCLLTRLAKVAYLPYE